MRTAIVLPAIFLMLFGFAGELMDLAEASSDKAIAFSTDMTNAIDCAAEARPLEECSPGIYGHDFSGEMEKAGELSKEMAELSQNLQDRGIDYTIEERGNEIVIVIRN